MGMQPLTRNEVAFVIGVPAAWAILLLFHPLGETFYTVIDDNITSWLAVHVGMAVFIPLFAAAVYLLLRGIEGRAATASRIGLALFAIFYAAFEITLGIGTGILTNEVVALPEGVRAVGAQLVESYAESSIITVFTVLGSIGLAVAMTAGAFALRSAYHLGWPIPFLLILCIPLIAIHEPPFGPIGLGMFIGAVLMLRREEATSVATSEPAHAPGPA